MTRVGVNAPLTPRSALCMYRQVKLSRGRRQWFDYLLFVTSVPAVWSQIGPTTRTIQGCAAHPEAGPLACPSTCRCRGGGSRSRTPKAPRSGRRSLTARGAAIPSAVQPGPGPSTSSINWTFPQPATADASRRFALPVAIPAHDDKGDPPPCAGLGVQLGIDAKLRTTP